MPDERGQVDGMANAAVMLVIALAVGSLIAAFMLPIGVDALVDDTDVSFTSVNEAETNEVLSNTLNVTLDAVSAADGTINVTLTDVDSGNTLVLTEIAQGSSDSGTLEGSTLTVTNDNAIDATTASFTVSHPVEYGWSSGAQSLWQILDVIIVLAVFLMMIGIALAASKKV